MEKSQIEALYHEWNNEDMENTEWYDNLTQEEQSLVDEWDNQYESGLLALAEAILKKER